MARKDMSEEEFAARRAAYDIQLVDTISKHGLALQGVFHSAEDENFGTEPDFVYTVGLAGEGKPELIAFGLPFEVAHALLNDLGKQVLAGLELKPGHLIVEGLLEGNFGVAVIAVKDSWEHLTYANRFYGNPDGCIPALQLVFPDMQNRLPWDPGSEYADWPVLGPVPTEWWALKLEHPE